MTSDSIKQATSTTIEINVVAAKEETKQFKQFDIVTDHSDHYYTKCHLHGGNSFNYVGSKVHKRIMKEWKILEYNLPKSIYVRVYEGRIDLLRAVIIGATGTPYHDGLFFFDFAFPTDYPNRPPLVYYHSHGLRLNPNLYSSGLICLSILNTWTGTKEERWNPSSSTILQVLLSLQALVLNEKPYYNEPQRAYYSERDSKCYNNEVFTLSCKTMLHLLCKPPKHFEGFVVEHFHKHGNVILRACKAYSEGRVSVGYYHDGMPFLSPATKVSRQLKATMDKLYLHLEAAFNGNEIVVPQLSNEPFIQYVLWGCAVGFTIILMITFINTHQQKDY